MSATSRTLTLALTVIALALPAISQAQLAASKPSQVPVGRVDLGFNAGGFLTPVGGLLAAGPNITIHSSRKRALEISSSVMRDHTEYSSETMVIYAVQYRRTFKDEGTMRSYWTVGGAGVVWHEDVRAHTDYYNNTAVQVKAHRSSDGVPPVLPVMGFGTEKFINPRLAIRADVVFSFIVARAAVGVSVPLGRLK